MVSVSAAGFNAITSANTLSLFKRSEDDKTAAKVVTASVQASTADRLGAIADLAAKLIDIKNGKAVDAADGGTFGQTSEEFAKPERIGDGKRPLSAQERAAEKANWEGYYKAYDDALRANFPEKVKEFLLQGEAYSSDPSFQVALKNGTLEVRDGKTIGIEVAPTEVLFNENGYYAGVRSDGMKITKNIWDSIESVDGKFYSRADGRNAAIGAMGSETFYVTWPKE
jgi:hypothetical protein